ncbi:MAG: hypothetical protein CMF01_10535 [Hyphomonas sp.]|nr:hypothetical protein [Hyphomonas sp.]
MQGQAAVDPEKGPAMPLVRGAGPGMAGGFAVPKVRWENGEMVSTAKRPACGLQRQDVPARRFIQKISADDE